MDKKVIILIIAVAIIGIIFFIARNGNKPTEAQNANNRTEKSQEELPMSTAKISADKLEVYYFHRTQRCYSCITLGQYIKETIEQKFFEEMKNGKIDFREINVDLPENKDVAIKFQASGSSLFINAIKDGQDDIDQDTNVWRLLNSKPQFENYLTNKINSLLGK